VEHRDKLELIAQTLLKVETLDALQIRALYENEEHLKPDMEQDHDKTKS
jgi:ATP-dependent Zn proteases